MSQSNLFFASEIDRVNTQTAASGVNTVAQLPNDTESNALLTMDHEVHEVHDGNVYTAVAYEALNAGSALTLLVTAPGAGRDAHIIFSLETDGPGLWTLSSLTDASGGTVITPTNHFPQSANTASTGVAYNSLVTSTGTILDRGVIGSAGKFEFAGGMAEGRNEYKLTLAEEITFVFTADLASCRTVLRAAWHEETD